MKPRTGWDEAWVSTTAREKEIMRVAYVDDTKQKGKRRDMGNLVALGSVIFDEDKIQPFAKAFRSVYDDFGVPYDVELKWANAQGRNWWAETDENRSKQTPFRQRMLEVAREHDVKIIVVIWDLNGGIATAGGQEPEDAVITFMFERISMQIENSGNRGIIVFDKPGGDHRSEADWITSREEMVRIGTEYVKPNAIVTQVFTAPSHLHPHLQLADLVAGSVTAAFTGNKYGLELMPLIEPMFCRGHSGVPSVGVKLYPDKLNNLHYWVYGATTFGRGYGALTLPLGKSGWRYEEGDGMQEEGM